MVWPSVLQQCKGVPQQRVGEQGRARKHRERRPRCRSRHRPALHGARRRASAARHSGCASPQGPAGGPRSSPLARPSSCRDAGLAAPGGPRTAHGAAVDRFSARGPAPVQAVGLLGWALSRSSLFFVQGLARQVGPPCDGCWGPLEAVRPPRSAAQHTRHGSHALEQRPAGPAACHS